MSIVKIMAHCKSVFHGGTNEKGNKKQICFESYWRYHPSFYNSNVLGLILSSAELNIPHHHPHKQSLFKSVMCKSLNMLTQSQYVPYVQTAETLHDKLWLKEQQSQLHDNHIQVMIEAWAIGHVDQDPIQ